MRCVSLLFISILMLGCLSPSKASDGEMVPENQPLLVRAGVNAGGLVPVGNHDAQALLTYIDQNIFDNSVTTGPQRAGMTVLGLGSVTASFFGESGASAASLYLIDPCCKIIPCDSTSGYLLVTAGTIVSVFSVAHQLADDQISFWRNVAASIRYFSCCNTEKVTRFDFIKYPKLKIFFSLGSFVGSASRIVPLITRFAIVEHPFITNWYPPMVIPRGFQESGAYTREANDLSKSWLIHNKSGLGATPQVRNIRGYLVRLLQKSHDSLCHKTTNQLTEIIAAIFSDDIEADDPAQNIGPQDEPLKKIAVLLNAYSNEAVRRICREERAERHEDMDFLRQNLTGRNDIRHETSTWTERVSTLVGPSSFAIGFFAYWLTSAVLMNVLLNTPVLTPVPSQSIFCPDNATMSAVVSAIGTGVQNLTSALPPVHTNLPVAAIGTGVVTVVGAGVGLWNVVKSCTNNFLNVFFEWGKPAGEDEEPRTGFRRLIVPQKVATKLIVRRKVIDIASHIQALVMTSGEIAFMNWSTLSYMSPHVAVLSRFLVAGGSWFVVAFQSNALRRSNHRMYNLLTIIPRTAEARILMISRALQELKEFVEEMTDQYVLRLYNDLCGSNYILPYPELNVEAQ